MNQINGKTIQLLRQKQGLTQKQLANQLHVSDKTISKWETEKGLPDISIINQLANALQVSITELFSGTYQENHNISANMKKLHFYVCPNCGNIMTSVGEGSLSCCGIMLKPLKIQNNQHTICIEDIENEYYVTIDHEMNKEHYISFIAYVTSNSVEIIKLYPEQNISVRLKRKGHGIIYAYCIQHGMFQIIV